MVPAPPAPMTMPCLREQLPANVLLYIILILLLLLYCIVYTKYIRAPVLATMKLEELAMKPDSESSPDNVTYREAGREGERERERESPDDTTNG